MGFVMVVNEVLSPGGVSFISGMFFFFLTGGAEVQLKVQNIYPFLDASTASGTVILSC